MEAKTKKTLWIFAGVFVVLLVIMGILGSKANKEAAEKWTQDSLAMEASSDSARKVAEAEKAHHDSLMANDKGYRDSVKKAEAELAKREEEEAKRNSPEKYINIDMGWRAGGFGAVAMADFTITNNSLVDMKDPVVLITYYGESGTETGSKLETLLINVPAGKKASSYNVNLGFIKSQTKRASATFVSATWAE